MITISHKIDERGVHYQTVKHSDYRTYGFRTSSYALGIERPNYPVPAIRHEVAYQLDDGDYWCGLYNMTLYDINPMHDDAFVMLWNVRDTSPTYWSPRY